uniref:Putative secreted protein n=1 Tax=Amblyomma americanum TaxID=6943 RepID=A0A0C9RWN0_AMBAM
MRNLTSLTLLAFIAGTLVLVAAVQKSKKPNISITDEDFDAEDHECPHNTPQQCSYRNRTSCYCKPPPSDYIRGKRYIYHPKYNKCFKRYDVGQGCNSFEEKNGLLDKLCAEQKASKEKRIEEK